MADIDLPQKFVVRRHTPTRTLVLRISGIVIGLFALYVLFEFGRYSAGYDRATASRQQSDSQQRIIVLKLQVQQLHAQVAQLQTLQSGVQGEKQAVAQELAELQAQVDRDRQDLAVYRGVIAPASSGTSLQVQQMRITAGEMPNHFIAHLTLMQAGKPDATVSGDVGVRITGTQNGATAVVDAVSSTPKGAVSFRYYQAVDYQIALPEGFKPVSVIVTLHDGRAAGSVGTQNFPWRLDVQS